MVRFFKLQGRMWDKKTFTPLVFERVGFWNWDKGSRKFVAGGARLRSHWNKFQVHKKRNLASSASNQFRELLL